LPSRATVTTTASGFEPVLGPWGAWQLQLPIMRVLRSLHSGQSYQF